MRDIVVLHHSATQRNDARLWRYCESMPLPHNLRDRIDLYRGAGRTRPRACELVADLSWFYTFDGLGIWPASYDPSVRGNGLMQAAKIMWSIREQVLADVRQARPHDSFFSEPVAARAAQ